MLERLRGESRVRGRVPGWQLARIGPSALASAKNGVARQCTGLKWPILGDEPRTATARHNPQQAAVVVPGLFLQAEVSGKQYERKRT